MIRKQAVKVVNKYLICIGIIFVTSRLLASDVVETVVLKQGFEKLDYFKDVNENGLVGDDETIDGRWGLLGKKQSEISDDQSADGEYSLKVMRGQTEGVGFVSEGVSKKDDFELELWMFRERGAGSSVTLMNENRDVAGVSVNSDGSLYIFDYTTKKWVPSSVKQPAETWVILNIYGERESEVYRAVLTVVGRQILIGTQPLFGSPITRVTFRPTPSKSGLACYFDDVVLKSIINNVNREIKHDN